MKLPGIPQVLVAALAIAWTSVPARADLVGHWKLDEGTGTVIHDSSGRGNHGVLVNPTADAWIAGRDGSAGAALYLQGTTGGAAMHVAIPSSASLAPAQAVSFAAWIRCDDIQRDAPILDKESASARSYWFGTFGTGGEGSHSGAFGVLLDNDGQEPWALFDRNQGNVFPGVWTHLASTWDGSTVRHYLNGVLLQETSSFSGPLHVSDGALVIGANVPFNTTAFLGALADLRLYDHALAPAEVSALVNLTPRCVAHWTFDEGTGTQVHDNSGAGNDGVLVNPTAATWTPRPNGSALYFDGTVGQDAAYVRVEDSPSLHIASAITFASWVRCDDISRDAPILAKEGDGKLSYWFGTFGLNSDGAHPGSFGVLLSSGGYQPWEIKDRNQGTIPEGEWVHLASSWDGATIRHFLNGRILSETASFTGPIRFSDAFLAIGVNSLYTFAANRTAFKGAIDDLALYNYALSDNDILALYLTSGFRITSVTREGNGTRIAWECLPGRRYVVQGRTGPSADGPAAFTDASAPIEVPEDYVPRTVEYVQTDAAPIASARFYRVVLLP